MWGLFFIGLLLGWGAAIPIGPLNLEIIRRNLRFGFTAGLGIGLGACSGDITYLVFLLTGALVILTHALLLKFFSFFGALILGWFGYQALTMRVDHSAKQSIKPKPMWRHYVEGYLLIMVSPYTVLFWLSVSAQVAEYAKGGVGSALIMSFGVIAAVLSWSTGLNLAIHFTRHKLSAKLILWLNRIGGIIILGFAVASMVHAFL